MKGKILKQCILIALIFIFSFTQANQASACELMGLSFDQKINSQRLFSMFRSGGQKNPDGWGLAYYTDKSITLFKEAANAAKSRLAESLTTYPKLKSKLLIAHLRKASVGGRSYQNAHPFKRKLQGKTYVFAHNGTLRNFSHKLRLEQIKPKGTTDSEFAFCYLLEQIKKKGIVEWDNRKFSWLHGQLLTINGTGTLNCLFSDGKHLFAYRDQGGYSNLYYQIQPKPHQKNHSLNTVNLGINPKKITKGVLIFTRPPAKQKWKKINQGQLLVFKNGALIFSSGQSKENLKLYE